MPATISLQRALKLIGLFFMIVSMVGCQENIKPPATTVKTTIPSPHNSITAIHPSAWPQAYKRFYERAEQGDPTAQNNLGRMYSDGRGVAVDRQQAAYWFSKAAQQGNIDAQMNLGACYLFGRGIEQNLNYACQLFKKAWLQGSREGKDFFERYCSNILDKKASE